MEITTKQKNNIRKEVRNITAMFRDRRVECIYFLPYNKSGDINNHYTLWVVYDSIYENHIKDLEDTVNIINNELSQRYSDFGGLFTVQLKSSDDYNMGINTENIPSIYNISLLLNSYILYDNARVDKRLDLGDIYDGYYYKVAHQFDDTPNININEYDPSISVLDIGLYSGKIGKIYKDVPILLPDYLKENGRYRIPKMDKEESWEIYQHFKPIVTVGDKDYFLRDFNKHEVSRCAYTWNRNVDKRDAVDVSELKAVGDYLCLHDYGFYGFFKPSIHEVIAQTPQKIIKSAKYFKMIEYPEDIDDLNHYPGLNYHLSKVRAYTDRSK